ncbi:hypothetical protein Tco_0444629 [Tanacetum coccineum]
MGESSNVLSSIVQEGVDRHVSQLPNGHVSQLSNRHVSQLPNGHRSVRRLGVSIAELRDLEDWGNCDVTLGLLERLRLDNVEKEVHLRLMMKETEVKIAEKNISIRRLRRNGAGIACGLRICMRRREVCIEELKALGDHEGVVETVRFMEGLQEDDMDRCNYTLALMREVEVKAHEKSRFILKLSGYEVD